MDRPQEKAEILTTAFIGVLTARASGAFDRLPDLDADDLTSLRLRRERSTSMRLACPTDRRRG
ncbi:hypothetical protein ACFPIJ_52270 [Dactylosporangium cerinum]|uniref:Uncharacterized protein n=1 Tax=Dactylosporangium cerinum TaxID=1434730 RepID=A0ABV9WFK9_9ACTN